MSNVLRILGSVKKLSENQISISKCPLVFFDIRVLSLTYMYNCAILFTTYSGYCTLRIAIIYANNPLRSFLYTMGSFRVITRLVFGKSVIILFVFWRMSLMFCSGKVHTQILWSAMQVYKIVLYPVCYFSHNF